MEAIVHFQRTGLPTIPQRVNRVEMRAQLPLCARLHSCTLALKHWGYA